MSFTTFPAQCLKHNQMDTTATVKQHAGVLGGIFVSSASGSPQITVYDGTSTSGTKIVEVFVPVASTFYEIPAQFENGLHVVIGGTVECTVLYA